MGKIRNYDEDFHRRVLVVDDEMVNREMLGMILSEEYDVIYAENGRRALEQVRDNQDRLSLILLDLLMPEMDGYAVLEQLRSENILRRIPVIVLTSEKSAEVKSLQLGAADFLQKPYDMPEVILARVRRSIELSEDANIIQATEYDALTGLYTREFFFEYGNQFDQYHPGMDMDAIVLNFNRFHLLNEIYGRSFGDQVLSSIAAGMREIVKQSKGIACRYDADTFYLYIQHHEDYQGLLEQLESGLSELLKGPEIRLRMGIYSDPGREVRLERRFDRALQACNRLRNQHTTSYVVYDKEMHEKEVFSARLMEDFETAIDNRQFQVLYQPKYNIKGDGTRLCSAEALICWMHPEFGRVSPGAFIPLFEENGMIQKLDRYVWREAAEQIRKWREQYGMVIPVSVNVSRVDIYAPDMTAYVEQIVADNQVDRKDYLLEITESAYTDNSKQIVQVVNELREKGFKVEMDDFGSGYSSLNMLTTLPIDALKLDMVFIRRIAEANKDMRMVELILEIAAFLGVPVVAEGVETEEQYQLLKNAGCDIIQGYYFSRPVPPEEFGRLIEKERENG